MKRLVVWTSIVVLGLALGMAPRSAPADPEKDLDRMARDLNAAWGNPPGPYSAASLKAQATQNKWGSGETKLVNILAQYRARTLMQQDLTLKPSDALVNATAQVTNARQHMGLGAIANSYDVKLGSLVSSFNKTAKDIEKAGKAADKAARAADRAEDAAEKASKAADKAADAGQGADRSGAGGGGPGGGGDHGGGAGGGGSGGGKK